MRYKIWVLMMLFSASALAQTEKGDSLLAVFNAHNSVQTANQFFSLLDKEEITDSLIHFPASTSSQELCQQVWYWASEYYLAHQNYEQGTAYGKKALPLIDAETELTAECDCLTSIAISYFRMGDFEQAIGYAKRCNELDLQAGDPDKISSSFNLLTAIFIGARQYEEAEKCIIKGLDYCRKAQNPQRQAILTGMACEVYNNMGKYEEALSYGQKALEMEQELKRKDKIAMRQSQLAESLMGLGKYDKAKQLLQQAIPELRTDGNRHSLGITCNQMGRLLLVENERDEAARYFEEALEIFLEQKDIFNESRSRRGLYEALRESNPALAMQHNDRYNMLRDSIFDKETGMLLSRYAAQLDNERLQAENEELQQERRRNVYMVIAAVILLALLMWGVSYWWVRRQSKRIAELTREIGLIREQNNQLRIQSAEAKLQETAEELPLNVFSDQQFLANVISLVNDNLPSSQFSVELIAQQLNMSSTTLRRRLQQVTGETPKSFITAIQMQKAVTLLTTTQLSVNDVAQQCGFNETSSFSRTFKRIYGVAPSQYVA